MHPVTEILNIKTSVRIRRKNGVTTIVDDFNKNELEY